MDRLQLLSKPRYFVFSADGKKPIYGIRLGFRYVSSNVPLNGVNVQPQYFVDVTDTGERQVMFVFTNIEPCTSSISDIYFNGSTSMIISVNIITDKDTSESDSRGCIEADFRKKYIPDTYHDSNTFQFVKHIPVGTGSKSVLTGINYGETLSIVFDLQPGITLPDIINALKNETLDIGIKVQGDFPGNSRLLINEPELHLTPPVTQLKIALA